LFIHDDEASVVGFIDPPPPANTVVVSHDQFMFAPNLGENPSASANVQHNEPIDFLHQGGELADLAALMVQAHAEGAHLMAAPDAIDMQSCGGINGSPFFGVI
jgi:hypothetical protein